MLYPGNIEERVGFNEIRALIAEACKSTMGIALSQKMSLSTDVSSVKLWLSQTAEMMQIISQGNAFPDKHY
ncbi:MAG: DNA mismatch repair protein MutS, partial [Bacteroidetes bacterium]|nr:DNA mismatch repair protein MutS [Bacteroidota bacterium]